MSEKDLKPYKTTVDVTPVEDRTGRWTIPQAFVMVQFRCSESGNTLCWPDTITFATQLKAGRYAYMNAIRWVENRYE